MLTEGYEIFLIYCSILNVDIVAVQSFCVWVHSLRETEKSSELNVGRRRRRRTRNIFVEYDQTLAVQNFLKESSSMRWKANW